MCYVGFYDHNSSRSIVSRSIASLRSRSSFAPLPIIPFATQRTQNTPAQKISTHPPSDQPLDTPNRSHSHYVTIPFTTITAMSLKSDTPIKSISVLPLSDDISEIDSLTMESTSHFVKFVTSNGQLFRTLYDAVLTQHKSNQTPPPPLTSSVSLASQPVTRPRVQNSVTRLRVQNQTPASLSYSAASSLSRLVVNGDGSSMMDTKKGRSRTKASVSPDTTGHSKLLIEVC